MKFIVGLGNIGKEYDGTRHNIGFEVIDALASAHKIKLDTKRDRAAMGRGVIAGEAVYLVKPQTFMNLSGEAVSAILRREGATTADLFVICDDIHLPVGKIRLRAQGSSGGQNGLKNIATHLATQEWARLRVGVGEPPPGLQIDWVLSRFGRADRKVMDDVLITAMGAAEVWVAHGIETAMNRFNAAPPPSSA